MLTFPSFEAGDEFSPFVNGAGPVSHRRYINACLHAPTWNDEKWYVICLWLLPRQFMSPVKPHCQSAISQGICLIPFKPQSPYPIILFSISPRPVYLALNCKNERQQCRHTLWGRRMASMILRKTCGLYDPSALACALFVFWIFPMWRVLAPRDFEVFRLALATCVFVCIFGCRNEVSSQMLHSMYSKLM